MNYILHYEWDDPEACTDRYVGTSIYKKIFLPDAEE